MKPDVALDARSTSHMSAGMLTYVRELMRFTRSAAPDLRFTTFGSGDNFDVNEQIAMPLELVRLHPRLVHFPTPFLPLIVPRRYIITIHDLIELRYPQHVKAKGAWYYRHVVRRAVRGARLVITDDERTRNELVDAYGIREGRVRVVPLGTTATFDKPLLRQKPERRYIIYAGNHRPHKDLPTLFAAWHALPPGSACDLYITGRDDFAGALDRYRRDDARIVVVGDVSEEQLAAYYADATAYVHPALTEGFGLPMLEAMRTGTPVIATETSVPTVLRPHALTFRPGDATALRELLIAALVPSPARAARVAGGRSAARLLTWERTARTTVDIYREALE